MQEQKNTKRPLWNRKLFVNSKIQLLLLRYAVSMGLLLFSLGMFVAFTFEKILTHQMAGGNSFERNDIIIFSVMILMIIIVCYLGMMVSNRIVGPIFRLVKHMEDSEATGKFEEIQFRKNDYFKEIAISYNKMVARFRESDFKK